MKITIELEVAADLRAIETRSITQAILAAIAADNGVSGNVKTKIGHPVKSTEVTDEVLVTITKAEAVMAPDGGWEFAPRLGRRRSKVEIKMHDKELELGRLLTPVEKGEADAHVELDEEAQAKAKEDTRKKIRIDAIADEANEAAAKELAAEAETADMATDAPEEPELPFEAPEATTEESPVDTFLASEDNTDNGPDEIMPGETAEAEIPKADNLDKVSSLFS